MEPMHSADPSGLLSLLNGIPGQLQMAREYAILGNYGVSLQHYDVVLGNIGKYVRTIQSTNDRRDWFGLKEKLQSEVKLIKEIQSTLAVFRQAPGSRGSAAASAVEDDDDPERWPAPAIPQSHHSKHASAPAMGGKPRSTAAGGSQGVSSSIPGAGPPAWAAGGGGAAHVPQAAPGRPSLARAASFGSGAPPPRGRAQPQQGAASAAGGAGAGPTGRPSAGGATSAAAAAGRSAAASGGSGKPPVPRQPPAAKGGAGGKAAAAGAAGTGPHGRPKYSELHHLAADTELIAMVETDMLDVNPNTSFDSIAGLEEAKGLINEA
jgi:hypothetical protein